MQEFLEVRVASMGAEIRRTKHIGKFSPRSASREQENNMSNYSVCQGFAGHGLASYKSFSAQKGYAQ